MLHILDPLSLAHIWGGFGAVALGRERRWQSEWRANRLPPTKGSLWIDSVRQWWWIACQRCPGVCSQHQRFSKEPLHQKSVNLPQMKIPLTPHHKAERILPSSREEAGALIPDQSCSRMSFESVRKFLLGQ